MATEALARRQPLWPSNVRRAELGAACELFGTDRTDAGLPRIDLRLCTERPGPVSWAHGFELTIASGLEAMDDVDLVVAVPSSTVPGSPATVGVQPSPAVTAALWRAMDRGARVASLCSASFLLARTGLLDGRATTHWLHADAFRAEFPAVDLVTVVLYVPPHLRANEANRPRRQPVTAGGIRALALAVADLAQAAA